MASSVHEACLAAQRSTVSVMEAIKPLFAYRRKLRDSFHWACRSPSYYSAERTPSLLRTGIQGCPHRILVGLADGQRSDQLH
jgi:hypothetical protein